MNYRHLYHAGNFADVLKHAVLALCLDYLRQKSAPFRVIDTHAGVGRYDLAAIEAGKTLEWADGVARLAGWAAAALPDDVAPLLEPYLREVRALNPDERLTYYPGSPLIARAVLRETDRLVVNEMRAEDHAALAALFAGDRRVRTLDGDGWAALKALLPPKERRGLILIDPPFERRDDYAQIARALRDIARRFATGMVMVWHPIKDEASLSAFDAALDALAPAKTLRARLYIRAPADPARLNGCGLYLVNPPWVLKEQLETLLPFLAERLAQGPGARFELSASGL